MFGRTTGKREVARFDFTKKPIRPCFLMGWAKALISFPDLKKRGFVLKQVNMENIQKPYLLLVTHSSMVDLTLC